MMKSLLAIYFLLIHTSNAVSFGRVFLTNFPMKTPPGTQRLIVKNVSELSEFAKLIHEEDDTRRILELREGVTDAKVKYSPRFTFRRICGTTYASVFGKK